MNSFITVFATHLLLHGLIPPEIQENAFVGSREVQTDTADFIGRDHHADLIISLKLVNAIISGLKLHLANDL